MAKTSVVPSVCYRNRAGETIKKKKKKGARGEGGKETKRGGNFGRDVIRHYIRNNLRVPSVTGAANCFHRESKGNNVHLSEKLFDLPVEIHTYPSFVMPVVRTCLFHLNCNLILNPNSKTNAALFSHRLSRFLLL